MRINAPPSRANVWVNCPGSPQMRNEYPELDSTPSESVLAGRAAHVIAAEMIVAMTTPGIDSPNRSDYVGRTVEGAYVDDEMFDGVMLYARDVAESSTRAPVVERSINRRHIAPDHWVIVDAACWDMLTGVLTVWDFKYGHGAVEAVENWQLVEGAKAFLDENCTHFDGPITVRLRIVQPRAPHRDGPIREWVIDREDVDRYADYLKERFDLTQGDSPPCEPGPWCKNCSARRACVALSGSVYSVVDYVESAPAGAELSGEMIAAEWRLLEYAERLVKARKTGIEEQVKHLVLSEKRVVPGVAVEPTRGRLAWVKETPIEEVLSMGDVLGIDLRKPQELITPTQAKKLGLDETVISKYAERPSTGYAVKLNDGDEIKRWFK